MILELQQGTGIFVRADKVNEILISGEYAHVYMESGHCHYLHAEPDSNPIELARDIMRRVNEVLYPITTLDLNHQGGTFDYQLETIDAVEHP